MFEDWPSTPTFYNARPLNTGQVNDVSSIQTPRLINNPIHDTAVHSRRRVDCTRQTYEANADIANQRPGSSIETAEGEGLSSRKEPRSRLPPQTVDGVVRRPPPYVHTLQATMSNDSHTRLAHLPVELLVKIMLAATTYADAAALSRASRHLRAVFAARRLELMLANLDQHPLLVSRTGPSFRAPAARLVAAQQRRRAGRAEIGRAHV